MFKDFHNFDIYPVITERFCRNGSAVETLKQVLSGDAKVVQLREKDYPKGKILEMALAFRKLTAEAGAGLIINDHVDIAMIVKADGVHLGQEDIPCREAKKLAPSLKVGVSTRNIDEALKAINDGADYINIGPIFQTSTKETRYGVIGVKNLKEIAGRVRIPFTVMGGIKEDNIREALAAGARHIAVVTEITMADDPEEKTRRLRNIIESCEYKYLDFT